MKSLNYLLIALCLMISSQGFAATPAQSLKLNMSGSVSPTCSFTVNSVAAVTGATPSTTSVTLTLNTANETPPNGAVVVTCNDSMGYSLTVKSANNGALKSGANSISYQLDLGQAVVTPTTSSQTIYSVASLTTPETASSKPLKVTYVGGTPSVPSGTYSDTVTFTLTGN